MLIPKKRRLQYAAWPFNVIPFLRGEVSPFSAGFQGADSSVHHLIRMNPIPPSDVAVIKFSEGVGMLETFPYGEGDAFENVVVVLELQDEITLVAVATVEVGIVDEGAFGGVHGFGDGKAGRFDG